MSIKLHNGDCLEVMRGMGDGCIDLTVTSPPYDNLRTYKDSLEWGEHVWKPILAELYRVTKDGGVVVWVVGDATVKGSETGTSFKQALWAMECGFRLHDTMIWHKPNPVPTQSNRYESSFEYMMVFSKGKPISGEILRTECKTKGERKKHRAVGGAHSDNCDGVYEYAKTKIRHNVWDVGVGCKCGHPAAFPEQLASDHIASWSNEGDIVFDPFTGSGTTGKMAVLAGRNFIGCEKVTDYYEIAKARIEAARN